MLNPVDANILFAEIPLGLHRRLEAAGARYYPFRAGQAEDGADDTPFVVRLVTSFETTEAEVDGFLSLMRG